MNREHLCRSHCCCEFTLQMEISKWRETFPKGFLVCLLPVSLQRCSFRLERQLNSQEGSSSSESLCWAPSIHVGSSARESSVFFHPLQADILTSTHTHTSHTRSQKFTKSKKRYIFKLIFSLKPFSSPFRRLRQNDCFSLGTTDVNRFLAFIIPRMLVKSPHSFT